eukprot:TRINITY_DN102575_c0_g1_i1.p5 TRINITY_DN102575_c0_g1~~TRINITY_DN102575_c0_g1_i1.p5  ORF type:complete len:138 (-),score=4.83 TRINITY_DN102575_c0_g1_i1:540-953(-)
MGWLPRLELVQGDVRPGTTGAAGTVAQGKVSADVRVVLPQPAYPCAGQGTAPARFPFPSRLQRSCVPTAGCWGSVPGHPFSKIGSQAATCSEGTDNQGGQRGGRGESWGLLWSEWRDYRGRRACNVRWVGCQHGSHA